MPSSRTKRHARAAILAGGKRNCSRSAVSAALASNWCTPIGPAHHNNLPGTANHKSRACRCLLLLFFTSHAFVANIQLSPAKPCQVIVLARMAHCLSNNCTFTQPSTPILGKNTIAPPVACTCFCRYASKEQGQDTDAGVNEDTMRLLAPGGRKRLYATQLAWLQETWQEACLHKRTALTSINCESPERAGNRATGQISQPGCPPMGFRSAGGGLPGPSENPLMSRCGSCAAVAAVMKSIAVSGARSSHAARNCTTSTMSGCRA